MTTLPTPGRYRHFKGGEYELLFLAAHTETGEEMAVYRSLREPSRVWVRPLSMWSERVSRENYEGPRFVPIEEGPR